MSSLLEDDILKIQTVCVLGAGDMGHGIAEQCIISGYLGFSVKLYDIKQEFLDRALLRIEKSLKILQRKRKLKKQSIEEIISRLTLTTDFNIAIANSDLIIEVIPEIEELKKKVLSDVETVKKNTAIIASNTSTISISALSQSLKDPSKFAGMHFFNPVMLMKSVEIIKNKSTSKNTVKSLIEFAKSINKIPVEMKDSPGFVVNRILSATQILLGNLVSKGLIEPNQIDAVMKNMSMPMGAFETMDFVGLDITVHAMNYLGDNLDIEYTAPKWMLDLVESNNLGKKTGQGIYKWINDRAQIDLNNTTDIITPLDLLIVQTNEATKLLEENIIDDVNNIDILIKNGTGNPMGVLSLFKSVGKEKIIERCNYFSELLNIKAFKPTKTLLNWESK